MHGNIGTYTYTIAAYLTDFRGKATLPMLGGFMLQAATQHAEERGFGYSFMVSKRRAWVLTRMNIELSEYPANDTEIKLHTWISDVNKLFTERCFIIEDHRGNDIGYVRSLWACIDMETRRPTNILELEGFTNFKIEKECPVKSAGKIVPPKEAHLVDAFKVKYSDVDINCHLNSMKYIEHFVDVFPLELHQQKEIKAFEINYIAEGKYGSQLDILQQETNNGVFNLEMQHDSQTICAAKVIWN